MNCGNTVLVNAIKAGFIKKEESVEGGANVGK